MVNGDSANGRPTEDGEAREAAITTAIRELAFAAWAARREPDHDTSIARFERAYLGHYSAIDSYVTELIDGYQLDAKLDAAIAQPFRRHVDIDVTALGQDLVASGTLYALSAVPVGVWVFNGEIE